MQVVTISGYAESGKDTVAQKLKEVLEQKGKRVIVAHYADLLKYICKQFFGWNGKKDDAGRTLLQHIGTDIVRNKNSNFWVNMLWEILNMFEDEWDYCIIPDCRFPNEADCMKKTFNGKTVRVVRPNYKNHLTEEQRKHPSETSMDGYNFDYLVVNTSWDNLDREIYRLARFIMYGVTQNSD